MSRIYHLLILSTFLFSCNSNKSSITGTKFNDPNSGGFMKAKFNGQETGPGLVFIEGGNYKTETQEVLISSFYMDQYEITNHNWNEYLYWTERVFTDFPVVSRNAQPNQLVWLENGTYNEPMFNNYLKHPAFDDYPVVGISWLQANNFCAWRTDRVNENILIREKILLVNLDQQNEPFTTGAYLAGQYENEKNEKGQLVNLDPAADNGTGIGKLIPTKDLAIRNVQLKDGMLLPKYRLPTAHEWNYANRDASEGSSVVWKGSKHKNYDANNLLNSIATLKPTDAYLPNDYGLYCMSNNVSEWVMDSYLKNVTTTKFNNPYTGENTIEKIFLNSDYQIGDKYDEAIYDVNGILEFIVELKKERVKNPTHIQDSIDNLILNGIEKELNMAVKLNSSNRDIDASRFVRHILKNTSPDYADRIQSSPGMEDYRADIFPIIQKGISNFIINTPGNIPITKITPADKLIESYKLTPEMAKYIPTFSFVIDSNIWSNNKIYKGGSWKDTLPTTQVRYLDKHLSSSTIGFRCAMDCLGVSNKKARRKGKKYGNISQFKQEKE